MNWAGSNRINGWNTSSIISLINNDDTQEYYNRPDLVAVPLSDGSRTTCSYRT
jgi:hypothetical protein